MNASHSDSTRSSCATSAGRGSTYREPRPAEVAQLERVEAECDAFLADLERLMAEPLDALRGRAAAAGVAPLVTRSGG